jgi:hypothetical protein
VSDAVTRITESLAGLGETEVTAVLAALGASGTRKPVEPLPVAPRTPLPAPGGSSRIRSEVEWV